MSHRHTKSYIKTTCLGTSHHWHMTSTSHVITFLPTIHNVYEATVQITKVLALMQLKDHLLYNPGKRHLCIQVGCTWIYAVLRCQVLAYCITWYGHCRPHWHTSHCISSVIHVGGGNDKFNIDLISHDPLVTPCSNHIHNITCITVSLYLYMP